MFYLVWGSSGGVGGADHGVSMMEGGTEDVYVLPGLG